MSIMPNLLINNSKLVLKSPLVKISAICRIEGTKGMQIAPQSIFSFMNYLSISTCFVQSCCIGLCAILIATLLSQYNFIGKLFRNSPQPKHLTDSISHSSIFYLEIVPCYYIMFFASLCDQISINISTVS